MLVLAECRGLIPDLIMYCFTYPILCMLKSDFFERYERLLFKSDFFERHERLLNFICKYSDVE